MIETERVVDISHHAGTDEDWCGECGAYMTMLSLETAAAIAAVGGGAILYWIANSQFHCQHLSAGPLRICRSSFLDYLKRSSFLPKPKPDMPPERLTK